MRQTQKNILSAYLINKVLENSQLNLKFSNEPFF